MGRDREGIFTGNMEINAARVLCALVLHIAAMPEVKCAITMIRFYKNNSCVFYSTYTCLICFMKLLGALQVEFSGIILMGQACTVTDVALYLLPFCLLSYLPTITMATLPNSVKAKLEIENTEIYFPRK